MKILPAALTALLVAAAPLRADVLDTSLVAAEARLLIHADVERLVDTTLFKLMAADPEFEIDEGLIEFQREIGLDLTRDVRSITIYGTSLEDESFVGLIKTSSKLDTSIQRLQQEDGYRSVDVDGYTLHSLNEGGETWYGYVFHEKDGDGRLFVISERTDALVKGIRVVDGSRRNLAEEPEPAVQLSPSYGSVFYLSVGISVANMMDFEPASEVSKLVKSFTLDLGEERETVYAGLTLESTEHEDSIKVQQVIQGGIALLSLISSGEANAFQDFANALQVERTGTLVTVSFRYGARALYEGLRELADH